jgi:hypothetical protein
MKTNRGAHFALSLAGLYPYPKYTEIKIKCVNWVAYILDLDLVIIYFMEAISYFFYATQFTHFILISVYFGYGYKPASESAKCTPLFVFISWLWPCKNSRYSFSFTVIMNLLLINISKYIHIYILSIFLLNKFFSNPWEIQMFWKTYLHDRLFYLIHQINYWFINKLFYSNKKCSTNYRIF